MWAVGFMRGEKHVQMARAATLVQDRGTAGLLGVRLEAAGRR